MSSVGSHRLFSYSVYVMYICVERERGEREREGGRRAEEKRKEAEDVFKLLRPERKPNVM